MEPEIDDPESADSVEALKDLPGYSNYSDDMDKTALLNWRVHMNSEAHNFFTLAEGYLSASLLLIQACLDDNGDKKADSLIYPILFNATHGLELYLKGLIIQIGQLLNKKVEDRVPPSTHNLDKLFTESARLIVEAGDSGFLREFNVVQEFIGHLQARTKDPTYVRYPVDKKGTPHFYVNTFENEPVNLALLNVWVTGILEVMDRYTGYIAVKIEEQAKYRRIMREETGY